jgi:predicted metalloprotease with PDZ domain
MKILLAALLVAFNANAQGLTRVDTEADVFKCAEAEVEIVDKNKTSFDKLFSSAMDDYNGAQPCIGFWARNVKGPGASACGASGPQFEVGEVQPGSSADLAGLKRGDVLLKVAGKPIRFHLDFELALLGAKPGSNLNVEVKQSTSTKSTLVQVGLMSIKPGSSMLCQSAR